MSKVQSLRSLTVKLNSYGAAEQISRPFKLYQGSYGFVNLQCLVPITQNTTQASVCYVYRVYLNDKGDEVAQANYNMVYVGKTELEGYEYSLFECPMPKEFTSVIGSLKLVFNYCDVENDKIVSILTTGIYETEVFKGGFNNAPLEMDLTSQESAQITKNTRDIEQLKQDMEDFLQPPDCTEADNVGTPNVELTISGNLKFSNLKGETGEKGDRGDKGYDGLACGKMIFWDTYPQRTLNTSLSIFNRAPFVNEYFTAVLMVATDVVTDFESRFRIATCQAINIINNQVTVRVIEDGRLDGPKGEQGVGITTVTPNGTDTSGGNVYKITLTNGEAYNFIAPKGATGDTGEKGNGIAFSYVNYQIGDSGTNVPTGAWSVVVPEIPQGKYLWTKTVIQFENEEQNIAYSVSYRDLNFTQEERDELAYIKNVVPSSATPDNQLVDKAFVNSTVNNMSAFYITSNAEGAAFATHAALIAATVFYSGGKVRVPTQNDYATVLADETQPKGVDGSYPTTRYVYQTEMAGETYPDGQWDFQYVVNNTSLTQEQVNAINSGITSQKITQMDAVTAAKYTKPSSGIPEEDLSSAVQTKLNEKAGVTGVKGDAESTYRTGNVNLTPANIGAANKSGDTFTGNIGVQAVYQDSTGHIVIDNNSYVYDTGKRVYSPQNPPPASVPSNMVTTDTKQTISGKKTFQQLLVAQAGKSSIEINPDAAMPYIDFHYNDPTGEAKDYDVRLINDASGQLTCRGIFSTAANPLIAGIYKTTTPTYFDMVTGNGTNFGIKGKSGVIYDLEGVKYQSVNTTPGYICYTSGLCIQWGYISTKGTAVSVTFPTSFSSIYTVQVNCKESNKTTNGWGYAYDLTPNGFKAVVDAANGSNWIAIGQKS